MRKTAVLLLAVLLLCGSLLACANQKTEQNASVAGVWKLTMGRAFGIELSAADLGMDISFELKEDGSAILTEDGKQTEGLGWELVDGKTVKLRAMGTDLLDLVYDGTTLTYHDQEIEVDLIFSK